MDELFPLAMSQSGDDSVAAAQHFRQAILRRGSGLGVRLPADCLPQAGLQQGERIEIVDGPDGLLGMEPGRRPVGRPG